MICFVIYLWVFLCFCVFNGLCFVNLCLFLIRISSFIFRFLSISFSSCLSNGHSIADFENQTWSIFKRPQYKYQSELFFVEHTKNGTKHFGIKSITLSVFYHSFALRSTFFKTILQICVLFQNDQNLSRTIFYLRKKQLFFRNLRNNLPRDDNNVKENISGTNLELCGI